MFISQRKYISDLLDDARLNDYKPDATSLSPGYKLSLNNTYLMENLDLYRRIVGRLLYLGFTRPYVNHESQTLSQSMSKSCLSHWQAAIHILKYLKDTTTYGLFYLVSRPLSLKAFSNADRASYIDSRRSFIGFYICLGSSFIFWKTKKQTIVFRSLEEFEYRALASTICELKWIKFSLDDIHIQISLHVLLHYDSKFAIQITANTIFNECTKHLDIDCHVVRNEYKVRFIDLIHLPNHE